MEDKFYGICETIECELNLIYCKGNYGPNERDYESKDEGGEARTTAI